MEKLIECIFDNYISDCVYKYYVDNTNLPTDVCKYICNFIGHEVDNPKVLVIEFSSDDPFDHGISTDKYPCYRHALNSMNIILQYLLKLNVLEEYLCDFRIVFNFLCHQDALKYGNLQTEYKLMEKIYYHITCIYADFSGHCMPFNLSYILNNNKYEDGIIEIKMEKTEPLFDLIGAFTLLYNIDTSIMINRMPQTRTIVKDLENSATMRIIAKDMNGRPFYVQIKHNLDNGKQIDVHYLAGHFCELERVNNSKQVCDNILDTFDLGWMKNTMNGDEIADLAVTVLQRSTSIGAPTKPTILNIIRSVTGK